MENNWLTPDELLRLLKAARDRSVRDWALLLIGYRHALRAQELSNLTLSDVDLKTRTIRVRRVKGSLENIQPLEKRAGQPLLDEPKALRLWLAERKDDSHFVFTSQKGGCLTTNAIWRLFGTWPRPAFSETQPSVASIAFPNPSDFVNQQLAGSAGSVFGWRNIAFRWSEPTVHPGHGSRRFASRTHDAGDTYPRLRQKVAFQKMLASARRAALAADSSVL